LRKSFHGMLSVKQENGAELPITFGLSAQKLSGLLPWFRQTPDHRCVPRCPWFGL